jgi:hypothetical protein
MPIPNTPKPAIPNIPPAPGVPQLPGGGIGTGLSNVVLLGADLASVAQLFQTPQWGLFTAAGVPAFSALNVPGVAGVIATVISAAATGNLQGGQSVGELEYSFDDRISTAPQEQGAFLSYNKVLNPFQGRVTYIVSGLQAQRAAFLALVQSYRQSLALLSLIMPEYTFPSCNIVRANIRRNAVKGVSMFAVDLTVEEVRITGTAAYSDTATPAGADQVNGGTVQPQTPTPAQTPDVPGGAPT